MRITDLLSIGKEYLLLGGLLAIVLIAVGMIKKKKISANLLVNGAFACYIVIVVGATLLSRTSYMEGGKIMPLFYSYKMQSYHGMKMRRTIAFLLIKK